MDNTYSYLNAKEFTAVSAGLLFSGYFLYLLIKMALFGEIPLGEPNPLILYTEILGMVVSTVLCAGVFWNNL
ncbi:hypothetical protein DRQ25_00285 [Candidatus Fermentibacteria bacterium]|nr:MAG: hypothetical protein DRQ25_00285 [Candidatus Fermentibacteria bacterium]